MIRVFRPGLGRALLWVAVLYLFGAALWTLLWHLPAPPDRGWPVWVAIPAVALLLNVNIWIPLRRSGGVNVKFIAAGFMLGVLVLSPALLLVTTLADQTLWVFRRNFADLRRGSYIKVLFNFANGVAEAAVAVILLRELVDLTDPASTRSVAVAVAILALVSVVSTASVGLVIWCYEGSVMVRSLLVSTAVAGMTGVVLTPLTIGALTLSTTSLLLGVLLSLSGVTTWYSFTSGNKERIRRQALERLYALTLSLNRTLDAEAAQEFVDGLSELFVSTTAELLLGSDAGTVRVAPTGSASRTGLEETLSECAARLWQGEPAVLWGSGAEVASVAESFGTSTAMVAPVLAEGRLTGIITLAGRYSGRMMGFSAEDATMLGTLAVQLGIAVEKGRLHGLLSSAHAEREELMQRSLQDSLTGLANRDGFNGTLKDAVGRQSKTLMAICFIDLDDFKQVNDRHGHAAGDHMLRAVAERLRGSLRPHDLAARFGGDEFGVLLGEVRDLDAALMVAQRIVTALSEPLVVTGGVARVGASVGVRLIEPGQWDCAALLRDADAAMYAAKRAGKGTVSVWSPAETGEIREAR